MLVQISTVASSGRKIAGAGAVLIKIQDRVEDHVGAFLQTVLREDFLLMKPFGRVRYISCPIA